MAEVRLRADKRQGTGKGAARKARAVGRIPGIVYGRGMEPVAVEVDRRDFVTALHTDAGINVLLDLEIDGTRTLALTRELQRDPVRGTLLHADFVKVDRMTEIEVEVPVHLVGEAPGAKEGGVLEHQLFTAHVRCLPTAVPEAVEADVSSLGIGDSLKVADLTVTADFTILNEPEVVVALVAAPVSAEELEAMEAAVAGEVPEEEVPEVAAEEGELPEGEEAVPPEGEAAGPEEQS
ncbi:MAG: 50S ribosomal protein L25/general stress protein Ctc [Actinomycetota bacterium]